MIKDFEFWFNKLDLVDGSHFARPWYQQHRSGQVCLVTGHTSSLIGPSPQALTLLGEVRFITWRLRLPYLGKCRWVPRHFWECCARLRYGPAPGPTLKKALCHTRPFGGVVNKYRWLNKLDSVDGLHFSRPWYQQHASGRVCLVSGHTSSFRRLSLRL